MLARNVDQALKQIGPHDLVVDIGGWAQPFTRAKYVIDLLPYETRGVFGNLGPEPQIFTKNTWILHDVSSKKPLPFRDKEVDFVICSHLLEDIRDPIQLCSEICRIGKRGYIEVPSRTIESIMGIDGGGYAGYYHHRWLIEIVGQEIVFRAKSHMIHHYWKLHLPRSYINRISEEERTSFLFWEGDFKYREVIEISKPKVARELQAFAASKQAWPAYYYTLESIKQRAKRVVKIALQGFSKQRDPTPADRSLTTEIKDCEAFWLSVPEIHSE